MKEFECVDIHSMNGDYTRFAFCLEFVKMTKKFIYARSNFYGWIYKIEIATGRIFRDGKQIAECSYYTYY